MTRPIASCPSHPVVVLTTVVAALVAAPCACGEGAGADATAFGGLAGYFSLRDPGPRATPIACVVAATCCARIVALAGLLLLIMMLLFLLVRVAPAGRPTPVLGRRVPRLTVSL